VSFVDNNLLSFIISVLENIKSLLVVDIDELTTLIDEDLPPSRV
jgi:hypothetical protein